MELFPFLLIARPTSKFDVEILSAASSILFDLIDSESVVQATVCQRLESL